MRINKIFGRKMTPFEMWSVITGLIISFYAIIKGNGNYIPMVFGLTLLIIIWIFIKNKQKNIVLLSIISLMGILLLANTYSFLTTTFSTEFNSVPPSTLSECQGIGGVAIPMSGECSVYFVETKGTAGEGFICCLPDTCDGEWVREYNPVTKIYEKVCLT